jgi:hypothetical protein
MTIPETFTNQIAKQFYDKSIITYTEAEVTEADGRVHKTVVSDSSFMGNVQFDRLGRFMEDYGLDEKVDISITTSTDTNIESGSIVGYGGRHYRVLQVQDADSHKLILGQTWKLKQSIVSA